MMVAEQQGDSRIGPFATQALNARSWTQFDENAIRGVFNEMIESQISSDETLAQTVQKAEVKLNSMMKKMRHCYFFLLIIIVLASVFLVLSDTAFAALASLNCLGPKTGSQWSPPNGYSNAQFYCPVPMTTDPSYNYVCQDTGTPLCWLASNSAIQYTCGVGGSEVNTGSGWIFTGCAPAGDNQPPAYVPNIVATGVSTNAINITWDHTTDNVGVIGYYVKVFIGAGSPSLTLGDIPETGVQSYVFTDGHSAVFPAATFSGRTLWSNTTYWYYVLAHDAAGNVSGQLGPVIGITLSDSAPPSTPTGLTATAQSSSQINLSWTASTDNIGVAGYRVYRNGTQVATSTATAYFDTALSPLTTYMYTVEAYDAALNYSGQSAPASAITLSSIQLPRTGQTTCYDTAGTVIPCAGTGQDGDIQSGVPWPSPRFTNNGDGTVTDKLTGLMWTKDGKAPGPLACSPTTTKTWQGALDYVVCLNTNSYLGYTDWHLPNVNELESLVHAGQSDSAAWLNTQGFSNVQSNSYWSSTTHAFYTDVAWGVSMFYGSKGGIIKSSSYYVWPVRSGHSGVAPLWETGQTTCYDSSGGAIACAGTGQDGEIEAGMAWPSPRFTVGTGTEADCVTDNLTGLMWTRNADLPGTSKTWQQALDYANGLSLCGYTDWHLPNLKELLNLFDFSQYNPSLPSGHPFQNVQSNGYWTSTTGIYYPNRAWGVSMWYDGMGADYKARPKWIPGTPY